eukprot:693256-Prorocentrum_minimum.AAC.43
MSVYTVTAPESEAFSKAPTAYRATGATSVSTVPTPSVFTKLASAAWSAPARLKVGSNTAAFTPVMFARLEKTVPEIVKEPLVTSETLVTLTWGAGLGSSTSTCP